MHNPCCSCKRKRVRLRASELADLSIPVVEAAFAAPANLLPHSWRETVVCEGETIEMTWAEVIWAINAEDIPCCACMLVRGLGQ